MKSLIEKSDADLQRDVLAELRYEPSVNVTDIGVSVKDGAVTLNGYSPSYGEKWGAVRATKRVAGVRAIADEIEVRLSVAFVRTDADIASAAVSQINYATTVPAGKAEVTVSQGWITLEGELEWGYQREAAQEAVRYLAGVRGVTNLITIRQKLEPANIATAIECAFERHAYLDAGKIHVKTSGSNVTLSGQVRHYAEREEAERVAWAAPGVYAVENQVRVEWPWHV